MAKKAGIVTFHNSYSLGACLQAFASINFVSSLGFDADFVNYRNAHEQNTKSLFRSSNGSKKVALKSFVKETVFKGRSCKKHAFEGNGKLYSVSEIYYDSAGAMNDMEFDLLVSGSDQIWNPAILGSLDEAYFLNFAKAKHRVALASSTGSHLFSNSELEKVIPWLENYDLIGVRETFLAEQLSEYFEDRVYVVPDPTLLFDGDYWRANTAGRLDPECQNNTDTDGYVLTYFVGAGFQEYYPSIKKYIDVLNLPVWNIQYNTWRREGVDKYLTSVSPRSFISLVDNASMIITDSFHGTAFALNLNTPFIAMNNKKNPRRVQELLRKCDLSMCLEPENISVSKNIDFAHSNEALEMARDATVQLYRSVLS